MSDTIDTVFAKRLKLLRARLGGKSQAWLAQALDVSHSSISHWEQGARGVGGMSRKWVEPRLLQLEAKAEAREAKRQARRVAEGRAGA